MNGMSKKLLLLSAAFSVFTITSYLKSASGDEVERMRRLSPIVSYDLDEEEAVGAKHPFTIERGDCTLTFGGKVKVEHIFADNAYMLNKNIPDENEYFKETVDLTIDAAFGEKKYGHKAVQFFTDIRHKSVWGFASNYADRDAGPIGSNSLRLSNTIFGAHAHTSGKPLMWLKDAWLQFSLNAALGVGCDNVHYLKLGWFPFQLGRGIAFGGFYGLNKEGLGLYSYPEDKAAPGILLHGTIIKDRLAYDIYYAKFEERNKNLGSTISIERRHVVGRSTSPWRGINKDDEVIAGQLKWTALKDNERFGTLELSPYIFYNAASDQKIEIAPDAKAYWGSYGLNLEHARGAFECGAEFAINYGHEKVFNIDRNVSKIVNSNGALVEQYTHIIDTNTNKLALVTGNSKAAAALADVSQDGGAAIGTTAFRNIKADDAGYSTNRFRPAYTNDYQGWMTVVDGAYTFEDWNLKVALAYGYASGDANPNGEAKDKEYNGFIGLHELYAGKRVTSVLLLDERLLRRPNSLVDGSEQAEDDIFFTDIQHVGFGLTWDPKTFIKDLSINPNIIGFWKTHDSRAFDTNTMAASTTENARNFMGTELNLLMRCSVVKDLTMFANFAAFFPGGFFHDVKGVPLSDDYFSKVFDDPDNTDQDPARYRIGSDTAFFMNIGFEFKF